jgi:hypothetical protein
MPPRSVIDHTAPIALTAANGHRPSASGPGGEAPAAASLEAFLARTRRLPACERSRSYHTASPRAPTSPALAAALHALQGKLVVVNEPAAVVIPSRLASAVRGLARRCRGDSPVAPTPIERADDRRARVVLHGARGAAWAAAMDDRDATWWGAALTAPPSLTIRHWAHRSAPPLDPVRDLGFFAEACYQLVVVVGRGDSGAIAELSRAAAEPPDALPAPSDRRRPWFAADVYVTDDDALRQMSSEAAALYTRVTGRAEQERADSYWHLAAWERFHEAGRVAGHVFPSSARLRPPLGARPAIVDDGSSEEAPDDWARGPSFGVPSQWSVLEPRFDRAALIPPGYCLVRVIGMLELRVVHAAT